MNKKLVGLMLILSFVFSSTGFSKTKSKLANKQISLLNLNLTILYVITRYVAPDRIDASKMFKSALESAAKAVPEIMVTKKGKYIELIAANKVLRIKSHVSSPIYLSGKFQKVFRFLRKNLPADVKTSVIENRMIYGLLETLDPHTSFLPPEYYKEMQIYHTGAFGGLGIVVSVCSGKLSVLKVLPNTPASRAKLKPGDTIVKIGNQPTANLTLSEAVKRLRGEPATPVAVEIKRKSWRKPRKMSIMRESIAYDSVSHKVLTGNGVNVGYVKIKSFQSPTGLQVKNAVLELKKKNVKGIILDLRDNGGGLLSSAIQICNLFMDSGTIVAQVATNRANNLRSERRADMGSTIYKGPLVVLINGGSASASEIVTGSLKYSGRAIVIGSRSFGKGSVQDVIDYSTHAALKITVAQYLTYGDVSIQGRGISPDIELHKVNISKKNRGRKVIYYTKGHEKSTEHSLKYALKAARKARKDKTFYKVFALHVPKKSAPYRCRYCGSDPDDPVRQNTGDFSEDSAIKLSRKIFDFLKGKNSKRRTILRKISKVIKSYERSEDKKISKRIKEQLKVDWSKGVLVKNPKIELKFKADKKSFKAGSWAKFKLSLKNKSKKTLYRVRVVVDSTNPRLNLQELLFGKVNPGQKVTKKIEIKIPRGVSSRLDNISFNLYSGDKKLKETVKGKVAIKGRPLPSIALEYRFVDTKHNDGILEQGEIGEFRVKIKNVGKGSTGDAKIILKNLTGSEVKMIKTKFNISNLKPGRSKNVVFKIKALKNTGELYWKFNLEVKDCIYGNNIHIPWYVRRSNKKKHPLHVVKGFVKVKQRGYFYDTPWSKSQKRFGSFNLGAVFKAKFRLNGFYAVEAKHHSILYIPESKIEFIRKSKKSGKFKLGFNYSSPRIKVTTPSLQIKGKKVPLSITINDSDGIRDYYVSVTNLKARVYARKIFYKSLKKLKNKITRTIMVPLNKGINVISISARDIHKSKFSENRVILSY